MAKIQQANQAQQVYQANQFEAQDDLVKALKAGHHKNQVFPRVFEKMLSRVDDLNFGNETNNNPLILVCTDKTYDENYIKKFVEMGADVNVVNSRGSTPLMLCAYYGTPEMVEFFADKGVDVNHVNNCGLTAMDYVEKKMYSKDSDMYKTVKKLLDASNPISSENEELKKDNEELKNVIATMTKEIEAAKMDQKRLQETIGNISAIFQKA